MDINVLLERPGHRIKHRRKRSSKVSNKHRVYRDESKVWFQEMFGLNVVEE